MSAVEKFLQILADNRLGKETGIYRLFCASDRVGSINVSSERRSIDSTD